MNQRDSYRDSSYFTEYIRNQERRIANFEKILVDSGERRQVCIALCTLYKDLIAAEFSAACELEKISSSFRLYTSYVLETGFSGYSDYVDCLSLAIILNEDFVFPIPPEYDDDLTRVLDSIVRGVSVSAVGNLLYPDIYGAFYEYFIDKVNFKDMIKFVNTGWYHATGGMYWHDRHKKENNTYSGYWCYVASALIRIKKDDALVSDNDKYIV